MATEPQPLGDEFEVTIAVNKDHRALLVDWPDQLDEWLDYQPYAGDCGFTGMPTRMGYYLCLVAGWELSAVGRDFPIVSYRTLLEGVTDAN